MNVCSLDDGSPSPLGVSWVAGERAYNFALYSKHATSVTLLLYRDDDLANPMISCVLDYRKHKSGRVWHVRIPQMAMAGATYYAYRVDGPAPRGRFEWHQFNPRKILFDPYARCLFFPPAFDRAAAIAPEDNAGRAPVGAIEAATVSVDWSGDRRPRHESDLVIYELHVRGFTQAANSSVAPERRGTYEGLIDKIPYLKSLGVTAVELMPVFQFDPYSHEYWGYNPLSFFAPHRGYACDQSCEGPVREFARLVRSLHQADIEVILDVVYNHTGEGDERGPTYSYKGIDNSTYYLADDPPARPYADFAGTDNTLHCANSHTRQLILDSLRWWAGQMHVDGFRFDLASIFSRRSDGTLDFVDAPIFGQIASDPALADLHLIAEPWDATGVYQLGRNFPGTSWRQWNSRFRDDVRRFLRGDPGFVGAMMTRLYGSDDLFPDTLEDSYRPFQSVNYVTCHDGFTLYDLLAYSAKRNWANGEDNTDGSPDDFSWNYGWEGGDGTPPEILKLRKRQAKNFCCLLLLANGTPMLRAGDEFLQTQGGNNNPYNQDNPTSWLDWSRLPGNADVFRFFQRMIAFRKGHPTLSRRHYWREDVQWFAGEGPVNFAPESRHFAYALQPGTVKDVPLYVMINAGPDPIAFQVQKPGAWMRVIDTARDSPDDFLDDTRRRPLCAPAYVVAPRSVVVLIDE